MANSPLFKPKSSDQISVRNLNISISNMIFFLKIKTGTTKTRTSDESNIHQLLRTPSPVGINNFYLLLNEKYLLFI
jgi:hypothetical protein